MDDKKIFRLLACSDMMIINALCHIYATDCERIGGAYYNLNLLEISKNLRYAVKNVQASITMGYIKEERFNCDESIIDFFKTNCAMLVRKKQDKANKKKTPFVTFISRS